MIKYFGLEIKHLGLGSCLLLFGTMDHLSTGGKLNLHSTPAWTLTKGLDLWFACLKLSCNGILPTVIKLMYCNLKVSKSQTLYCIPFLSIDSEIGQ